MLRRILALMGKEFIQIRRDHRTLAMIIAIPVVWLIIFGYAADFNIHHLKLIILNQDESELATVLEKAFRSTDSFQIVGGEVKEESAARSYLQLDKADLALIIPAGFGVVVLGDDAGAPGEDAAAASSNLKVLVDGADFFSAQSAAGLLQKTLQNNQAELQRVIAENNADQIMTRVTKLLPAPVKLFIPPETITKEKILAALPKSGPNLVPSIEYLYNPEVRSSVFMIPAIAAMVILLLTVMLTSLGVVRERERGTLEQLVVSPLRPLELMLGKVLPYAVVSLLDLTLVLVAAIYLFSIPFAGNLWIFYGISIFFLLSALGLGLLASTAAQNQQQAMQMAIFIAFPQMLISGVIFPLEAMPAPIVAVAKCLPLTYFVPVARGMFIKGLGLDALGGQAIALVVYGVVMIVAASLVFRRRLD